LYPGRPHVFFGESESLKSWAALAACLSVLEAGLTALYIDFEGAEASFVERARHVGIPEGAIGGTLCYVRPTEAVVGNTNARADLEQELKPVSGLVVLDGVTEAYALHGWNINDATDAAKYQAAFSVNGAATISIDHTAKEAGRGVLGSQHKRAGLDGAEYEFRSRVRGGRGGESIAEVRVSKDRHGYVREWAPASNVVGLFKVTADGAHLVVPGFKDMMDDRDDRVDQVVAFVEEHPRTSANAIRIGLGMGDKEVREALRSAEMMGRVRNDGKSTRPAWVVSQ
jgi:hypothetical protein